MPARPRLGLMEIVLGVGAGAVAAGGAAAILGAFDGTPEAHAGDTRNQVYAVAPFEEIASVGSQSVVVTDGEMFAVRAEGSAKDLAQLEAVVRNGKLTIRSKSGDMFGFDPFRHSTATFYVTMPRLASIALVGLGDARIDRVEGERFKAAIVGPAKLSILSLKVNKADFSIKGPGSIDAAGTAGDARIEISGPGEIDASDLTTKTAWVSNSGSGDASLTVEDEAQVSIKGSGDVDIGGAARCIVSRNGEGDVRCESQEND